MSDEVQVEKISQEVAPVVARAAAVVVSNPDQYREAGEFLKLVKAAQKKVEDWFAEPVKAAHQAWKALTNRRDDTMQPLLGAERTIKNKMVAYANEQERIRRAEQERLQAEADEKARQERERLEKQAAKIKTPDLKHARMDQAAAVVAPVVVVASVAPSVSGQSLRKTWRARITDPKAAVAAVLQWPDWASYVSLNGGEFNRLAARTKGATAVPGVEWYEESTLSSR
jgi:hypothetical protein